jgi:hypothetical protein
MRLHLSLAWRALWARWRRMLWTGCGGCIRPWWGVLPDELVSISCRLWPVNLAQDQRGWSEGKPEQRGSEMGTATRNARGVAVHGARATSAQEAQGRDWPGLASPLEWRGRDLDSTGGRPPTVVADRRREVFGPASLIPALVLAQEMAIFSCRPQMLETKYRCKDCEEE